MNGHNSNQIFLAPQWMVTGPGTYQQRPWTTNWLAQRVLRQMVVSLPLGFSCVFQEISPLCEGGSPLIGCLPGN